MNHKTEIEAAIIGACILESATIGHVQHILKPVNFSTPDRQQLWAAMQRIYPDKLDMLILCHYMHRHHQQEGKNWAYTISHYTQHVHSAANVVNWAFILLEINFRQRLIEIISQQQKTYKGDLQKQAYLKEMLDYAEDQTNDVFKVIEAASRFLKAYKLTNAADEIDQMDKHINKRIMQIKLYDQAEHLRYQLDRVEEQLQTIDREAVA